MKVKVLFTLFPSSSNDRFIFSGFRPDWKINFNNYNCGRLLFDKQQIHPNEQTECIIEPLNPYLWKNVAIGDILECMEGVVLIGEAVIIEIM
tara:strand:- start:3818 stop:4093 length:276 start_codon:yes stop_codon:yes gene_type:complete